MDKKRRVCPDCSGESVDRRQFLTTAAGVAAAAAAGGIPLFAVPKASAAPTPTSAPETAVKGLYDMLTDEQKKVVCFDWDYMDKAGGNGLLRTHVSNNWHITKPAILSDFYNKKQQDVIHDIWKGIINPDWEKKFLQQLKDDTGGGDFGEQQNIAIFGKPGDGKFEFVITGRHMTLRADGHSQDHVAFGGPIFYGHQASTAPGQPSLTEKVGHPGNVFIHQAIEATKLYGLLDTKQQATALIQKKPAESAVAFQGDKGKFPGLPVSDLSNDQKTELQKILALLLDPFRKDDQDEAMGCLKREGGLDHLSLAFYKEGNLEDDGSLWDCWRLEGPAFVWYFRGSPHVHVWVNVADDPSIATNAKG
ncbi:MAG TPA: DUF3500 domain-containing protein [Gemmataceae bacterium]|nr:DUF3500 domain-containing protein [Gemmataceae bacterium]